MASTMLLYRPAHTRTTGMKCDSTRTVFVVARIVYEPPLPAQTMHVLQRMPAGCMTKVIITYQHVGTGF